MVHHHFKASLETFLQGIAPSRDDGVVAVECIFTWYGLADLCAREGMACVLGHALSMNARHGGIPPNARHVFLGCWYAWIFALSQLGTELFTAG
jgi:hypothetical protein